MCAIILSCSNKIQHQLMVIILQCVPAHVDVFELPDVDSKILDFLNFNVLILNFFSESYHVSKPPPFYIQPMPKPRYGFEGFRDFNKERLKKISLSSSSLPPVGLFPTEDKSNRIPAISDELYQFESEENINDSHYYNYYDNVNIPAEYRHPSLEYFDDFYPIEHQFLFDPTDEDEEGKSGPNQMTTTTTIASFKCQTHTQQTSVTIYQTHNRASSL